MVGNPNPGFRQAHRGYLLLVVTIADRSGWRIAYRFIEFCALPRAIRVVHRDISRTFRLVDQYISKKVYVTRTTGVSTAAASARPAGVNIVYRAAVLSYIGGGAASRRAYEKRGGYQHCFDLLLLHFFSLVQQRGSDQR